MAVTLGVPTLRRYDTLQKLLESAAASSMPPDTVILVDNGRRLPKMPVLDFFKTVIVVTPHENLGVAMGWNHILRIADDDLIITNDDVEFYEDSIEKLVSAAKKSDGIFFWPAEGGNAWSCFLQKKSSLEKVGYYDPNFKPAYFEDNDYSYRLKLAGYSHEPVYGCAFKHVGSATMAAAPPHEIQMHHRNFERNRSYYVAKWGGIPDQEKFTLPWNGQEPPRLPYDYRGPF